MLALSRPWEHFAWLPHGSMHKQNLLACQAILFFAIVASCVRGEVAEGIKDVFYETRVLMGREYTLRRFANGDPRGRGRSVMLGYIEKGTRFPNERWCGGCSDPQAGRAPRLLALAPGATAWISTAFGRELRRGP